MYRTADMSLWQGRIDNEPGENALRWHQRVRPLAQDGEPPGIALLGVCSDEGVKRNHGRSGARGGPDAIRRFLANQAWHLRRPVYDAGNLFPVDGNLEALQLEQSERVADLLMRRHFPLLLGGGHEIAFGSYLGLTRQLGNAANAVGIINFDAHFDLRLAAAPNSGTPFLQMAEDCRVNGRDFNYLCLGISETANTEALFERAAKLRAEFLTDGELVSWAMVTVEQRLRDFIDRCGALYLSIDLDALPAAVAPGVSAPAPRGVPLEMFEHLIGFIRQQAGNKLRLADIAEYNPEFDIDMRTARVAARFCHLLLRDPPAALHQQPKGKE